MTCSKRVAQQGLTDTQIIRVEQLYPFPGEAGGRARARGGGVKAMWGKLIAATALVAISSAAAAHGAGEPAPAEAATSTVRVEMSDAGGRMRFQPDRLEVKRGAVVKFVVHNAGAATHEFVLGARADNAAHARMMARMPDMRHDEPDAKTLNAGQTATLVWRFTRGGEFEYACLLPGHYEAGMHGAVTVK